MDAYQEFLARKRIVDPMTGLDDVDPMPSFFKPHQSDITTWALRRGRSGSGARFSLRSKWDAVASALN